MSLRVFVTDTGLFFTGKIFFGASFLVPKAVTAVQIRPRSAPDCCCCKQTICKCSVVVAKRRCFFLASSVLLIEILPNCFFQLYNCNNHTAINVQMDSQDDLNLTKASDFTENCRNCKIYTKPNDQILETTPKRISSVMGMNVLLSQNNYLCFGITYSTSRFYKGNWLENHKNQAVLMKLSKNTSTVLLGDSIVAGFLRYPNIWYKFFNENTINCGIGGARFKTYYGGWNTSLYHNHWSTS